MLKSGILFENKLMFSTKVIIQVGILNPYLLHFMVNGLQNIVESNAISVINSKIKKLTVLKYLAKYFNEKKTFINLFSIFFRYVDSVIIICKSKIISQKILTKIISFLMIRSLELVSAKTFIINLKNKYFDFLGYRFKHNELSKKNNIYLFPSPIKLIEIKRKIRAIFFKSQNCTSSSLIKILNPIVRGWCNYCA